MLHLSLLAHPVLLHLDWLLDFSTVRDVARWAPKRRQRPVRHPKPAIVGVADALAAAAGLTAAAVEIADMRASGGG